MFLENTGRSMHSAFSKYDTLMVLLFWGPFWRFKAPASIHCNSS